LHVEIELARFAAQSKAGAAVIQSEQGCEMGMIEPDD